MNAKAPKESQAEKFKRLAREVGASEDERAFDEALKKMGKPKPKKEAPDN